MHVDFVYNNILDVVCGCICLCCYDWQFVFHVCFFNVSTMTGQILFPSKFPIVNMIFSLFHCSEGLQLTDIAFIYSWFYFYYFDTSWSSGLDFESQVEQIIIGHAFLGSKIGLCPDDGNRLI